MKLQHNYEVQLNGFRFSGVSEFNIHSQSDQQENGLQKFEFIQCKTMNIETLEPFSCLDDYDFPADYLQLDINVSKKELNNLIEADTFAFYLDYLMNVKTR